MLIVVPSLCI